VQVTKAQIWAVIKEQNAALKAGGKVTIKTEQLKRLVDFVYDRAVESRGVGRVDVPDVLMGLFGRK
jgi:hypothetical protein